MGWGRWFLLGDIGQQLDLSEQAAELDQLRRRLSTTQLDAVQVSRLLSEVNELKLYMASVFRVLSLEEHRHSGLTCALIETVDAEDGATDNAYHGDITPAGGLTAAQARMLWMNDSLQD